MPPLESWELRRLRRDAGLTRKGVESKGGPTTRTIYSWERGKHKPNHKKMAAYLSLLCGEAPKPHNLRLLILHALAVGGGATLKEIATCVGCDEGAARIRLAALSHLGLVEQAGECWRIRT